MRLNVIGCGNVGMTLTYLWREQDRLQIGDVLNRSYESAERAVTFIQAGRAIRDIDQMQPADLYLIGCSDSGIENCCEALAGAGLLRTGDIVFHCSGALNSMALSSAKARGAVVASMHPIKSFADPATAVTGFAGTYCGLEGDLVALQMIEELVDSIEGNSFTLDPENKTYYHAASVIACNYLVALEDIALRVFERAGIERDLAARVLPPIVDGTVENLFTLGPVHALTGPIARGDHEVVSAQLTALQGWNPEVGELYRLLGQQALSLSKKQGSARQEDLDRLVDILKMSAARVMR